MALLFAYGTLLDERVQRAVFGRRLHGRPDVLAGYVRAFVEVGDARYPNVVATGRTADVVPGEIFELTEDDLRAADVYETAAYTRREVTLTSGLTAWVYVSGGRGPAT